MFILILLISATSVHTIAQLQNTETDPYMILISPGTFMMGQKSGEGEEKHEHEIMIDDFLFSAYEVTVPEL